MNRSRTKKLACTVSAAALMLGVSSAATIGLKFQCNYCGSPAYSGYQVTATAFGVPPSSWENLLEMGTGYSSCSGILGYTLSEVIDTTTSTNGLNPLPNGSLSLTWFGPTANYATFGGYGFPPPRYQTPGGGYTTNQGPPGEVQVYATFIRDGLNFGPGESGGNNTQPGYWVDITGMTSLFPTTPYVVELMASADSMETITNAFIYSVSGDTVGMGTTNLTNTVSYPNTPPVPNVGDTTWIRGNGGGLSTGSGPITNADHIVIVSAHPAHGGSGASGYNMGGTISGAIITDEPVVSMSPQPVPLAAPGDTVQLSAYAIGVPPLSYQWRLNGTPIAGATSVAYTLTNVSVSTIGNYDLVVSNPYGVTTSKPALVGQQIVQASAANVVLDSNPANPQNNGVNKGAAWLASSSDGSITRTGVMAFAASNTGTEGVTAANSAALDNTTATLTFWMKSAGTLTSVTNGTNASLFCRPGNKSTDFEIMQQDGTNTLVVNGAGVGSLTSAGAVSDGKWHFVAVAIDQSVIGGITLYIDGAQDANSPFANPASWSWPSSALQIGYSTDSGLRAYNGQLSDVRFYGTVLSSAQISSIYSTGAVADAADLQMELAFLNAPGVDLLGLTWIEPTAVLQTATSLSGPWTSIPQAKSPYVIVVPSSSPQQFYQYQFTPHSATNWVSNPYLM